MKVALFFLVSSLLGIPCAGQSKEEVKELVFDGTVVLLGEVPAVGVAVKIFAPALKTLLGIKQQEQQPKDYTKNFKELQKGLSEMRTEVIEAVGRIEIAVELAHVSTSLTTMKHSLNGILHELTIVAVAQHYFSENESERERDDDMKKWTIRLDDIRNITKHVFEELLRTPYMHKMENLIVKVISTHPHLDLKSKSIKIADSVYDIYTSDRFQVMLSRQKLGGKMMLSYGTDAMKFAAYAPEDNRFSLEYDGYFVEIQRSITAYKLSSNDIASFHNNVDEMHKFYHVKCPFVNDGTYRKDVLNQNFTVITMFEATAQTFLYLDDTATYSPPPIQCPIWHDGGWKYPTFRVRALPL